MKLSKKKQIEILEATLCTFKKTLKEKKGTLRNPYYLCGIAVNKIRDSTNHSNCSLLYKFIPDFNFQKAEELARKYKFKKPSHNTTYWWELKDLFDSNSYLVASAPPVKIDIVNRKRFLSCLIKELKNE
jgi:hypothetical protein